MTQSLWLATTDSVSLPTLSASMKCDVCIIGGGLSGLYTAYTLANAGVDVVLLEANSHVSHGTTGHSTGKLTAQHGIIYSKLLEKQPLSDVQLYYQLNQFAIEKALHLLPQTAVRKADSVLYSQSEESNFDLMNEWSAYKAIQIDGKLTTDTELPFAIKNALVMPHQAQINPVEVANTLAKKAQAAGAKLYTSTRVQKLKLNENEVQTQNDLTVQYKQLVLCTHYPIEAITGLQLLKLSNSRSYIVASKITDTLRGQYISVDAPTRSIRTTTINGENYLLLAGAKHIAGQITDTTPFYEALQKDLKQHFDQHPPLYEWSAQDVETPDMLPYVGKISKSVPNVYMATGYRKWGISNSFVAGDLLCSLITKTKMEDGAEALYSPSRTKFGAAFMQMLKVGGFVSKELVAGYMKHKNAPKCTHLGCKTKWNKADKTWDCPCHGSRFNAQGEVIEGPAVYPLKLEES